MRHFRRTRLLARRGNRALLYYAPTWSVVLLVGLVSVLATAAVIAGYALAGAVVIGVVVFAWLGFALRVTRLEPFGRRGDGSTPPGGAGVREPRRPLPNAPAGAAAMPIPDEEPSR